jgi:hypothetical protein
MKPVNIRTAGRRTSKVVPGWIADDIKRRAAEPEMQEFVRKLVKKAFVFKPSVLDQGRARKLMQEMKHAGAGVETNIDHVWFGATPAHGFVVLAIRKDGSALKLANPRVDAKP